MKILTLTLEHFRSYPKLSLPFDGKSHLFVGPNGSGKTNILESISYLSEGRSCLRAAPDDSLRWDESFFRIKADIQTDEGESRTIEYVFQELPKRETALFVQDSKLPLLKFIGSLPTIVFLPQSLDLFTGGPDRRRQFLDSLLSQLDPAFATARIEYERLLKQRNALLRQIADSTASEGDLDLWDERLAESGAAIIKWRTALLEAFNKEIGARIVELGEDWSDAEMVYECSSRAGDKASILESLRSRRRRDLLVLSTSSGPHRDDWSLVTGGRNIALFASRGEQRSALVALLLLSAEILRERRSEAPVVLLDDVFSELDTNHQEALLRSLKDFQVLITSTHEVKGAPEFALHRMGETASTQPSSTKMPQKAPKLARPRHPAATGSR